MKTVAGSFRYVSGVQSSHRDVVEFPQGYLTVRGTTVDIVAGRTRTLIILIEGAITVVPFATRIPHDLSIPGTSLIVYNDGHVDGPMTREAALEKLHLRSDQFATTIWPTLQADSRTGFYVGVNVGHSWGQGAVTYNEAAFDFGGFPTPNSITGSNNLNGAIGGVQIGYNWQLGTSWVTGWEADLQLADEKTSKNFNFPDGVSSTGVFSLTAALNSKIIWFGTVRAPGRLAL
jgi:hypothetical protein